MPESPIRKLVPYAEDAKKRGLKVFDKLVFNGSWNGKIPAKAAQKVIRINQKTAIQKTTPKLFSDVSIRFFLFLFFVYMPLWSERPANDPILHFVSTRFYRESRKKNYGQRSPSIEAPTQIISSLVD